MKVTMIGTGYVGLVTGTCLSESGNQVTCLDVDQKKIAKLRAGHIPIFEPGLAELVKRNSSAGRLRFTTDYDEAIAGTDFVFIAVGTPQSADGSADLSGIWSVVDSIAPRLDASTIVVIKSTVPVGTNRAAFERLRELTGRDVDVASNPEFLKEGAAINDFTKPDRVAVGVQRPEVADRLRELYGPFLRTERPFLAMGLESAEMTKYVANCLLATKISFINEMANICERVGADVNDVRRGIGHDVRIGFQFLFPGVGYGGSCFPKDVRALSRLAEAHDFDSEILRAVDHINDRQKSVLFEKINRFYNEDLTGKTVAVWGLAFKPKTDDIREAPAVVLLEALLAAGARARVHDPVAIENIRAKFGETLTYCDHHYDAVEDADCLAIVTEWSEFRSPDFDYLKYKMTSPTIFDGRNLYDPEKLARSGFYYSGIGIGSNGW